MASHRQGREHAGPGPDRIRQDPRRLPCGDRPSDVRPGAPKGERCRILYVSPLKALAVDVERNLRAPIEGISRVAERRGESVHLPQVAIRSGDTPAAERARMRRRPPDILITTPESLFLILTSRAREILGAVETLILDEIHVLVGTKRGAHLALSLERLEEVAGRRVQRIGLSATQRPLEALGRHRSRILAAFLLVSLAVFGFVDSVYVLTVTLAMFSLVIFSLVVTGRGPNPAPP